MNLKAALTKRTLIGQIEDADVLLTVENQLLSFRTPDGRQVFLPLSDVRIIERRYHRRKLRKLTRTRLLTAKKMRTEGKSWREIAEFCGVNESTIWRHFTQTRRTP